MVKHPSISIKLFCTLDKLNNVSNINPKKITIIGSPM